MNRITVTGRLTADAELRYTPEGSPVAEFRFAVRDDFLEKKENRTVFVDVVVWGERAERIYKTLLKGKLILIEGRLDIKINKADSGKSYMNVCVYANEIEFMTTRAEDALEEKINPEG